MKTKIFALAGIAAFAAIMYYVSKRTVAPKAIEPRKEAERHHLTNVFSKAKKAALGN